MSKTVLIFIGGIVLVLAVFIWQVVANLDSIVAGAIEDAGSDALKTEVSVSGVSIDLKNAKAGIAGMTIANPAGYSGAKLFEMEGIEVGLDLESLGGDVLVIQSIRIQNPIINFEGDASGGSNMQTLLNNIKSGSSHDSPGDVATGSDDEPRMIIESFQLTGGQVKATSELKPGEVLDLKLPAINMSGIGKSQGGVTADVVAHEIATELVNEVISATARAGVSKLIEEKSKGWLDKLKGKD